MVVMTDPTHPDGDARQVERLLFAHQSAEPDATGRRWCKCQPWDTKDEPFTAEAHRRHVAEVIAAAVAVPPAAGPDDGLRARIDALCASWPQYTRNDPSDYGRGVAHARDAICAVLAAVPSAGLPDRERIAHEVWLTGRGTEGGALVDNAGAKAIADRLIAAGFAVAHNGNGTTADVREVDDPNNGPSAGLPTPPEADMKALRAAFIAGAKWADDACPVHAYGQVVVGEAGRRYGDPAAADVAEGGAR